MVSNGQIEDRWKKHANKMTKIQWTKRSVSVPKSHRGETNKMQIPASEQCNSVQTPMVAESLFELSLEKGVDDKDKSIFDKPREITAIPFEKAPTEMVHATRMIRSQSVKLIYPYNCFPNLAEKNYLEQPGSFALSASMKGSVSSTGDSLTDMFSFRCKSARTVAESLFKKLLICCCSSTELSSFNDFLTFSLGPLQVVHGSFIHNSIMLPLNMYHENHISHKHLQMCVSFPRPRMDILLVSI